MNELNNLANVVIGKLGKLVHKQKRKHDNNTSTDIAEKNNNSMYKENSNTKWAVGSISWNS